MSDEHVPEGVISSESDAKGIEIVRIFDAPRSEVFKAWTEPERFATWFGGHGSSIPLDRASMDVRPGGAWVAVMIIGPGQELVFSGQFLEVDEPERLVMTVTDRVPPDGEEVEVLTVVLEEIGDGRTRMTFTQRGGTMPPGEYQRTMEGWLVFFERLGGHLKTRHDAE
jgi:uncharacterized protein YndB with AHSA1/START domain